MKTMLHRHLLSLMDGPYLYIVQQIMNVTTLTTNTIFAIKFLFLVCKEMLSAEITSVVDKFYAGTATGLVLALIPFIAAA